jgi:hypothetical protein
MNRRSTGRPPLLAARGGISWVTLLLLAVLATGAYLAWVWVPIYLVHYEVKQVVHDYMNQAVTNRDDEDLVRKMCHKLRTLAEVDALGVDGEPVRVPAVDVDPGQVSWERGEADRRRVLRVAFEYTRVVEYPWIDQSVEKTFAIDAENDLARADWGPMR